MALSNRLHFNATFIIERFTKALTLLIVILHDCSENNNSLKKFFNSFFLIESFDPIIIALFVNSEKSVFTGAIDFNTIQIKLIDRTRM